jgi:hypothetical protein
MDPVAQLATVALLATLVEMLVEYFLKPLLPKEQPELSSLAGPPGQASQVTAPCGVPAPSRWWSIVPWSRYVAALAAVALALAYNVDVLSMMIPGVVPSLAGVILTGLVISRGSNYVHDLLGK